MAEHLKIREAVALLELTSQTLRNCNKEGTLKSHRQPIKKSRLYKESDLMEFLDRTEEQ